MKNTRRNDQCPCGSGKKYKRCCLSKDETTAATTTANTPRAATGRALPESAWMVSDDDGLDEASNRVVHLVHEGKLDEAERAARDLLANYPDVHDGLERLAMVFDARGDRKQAADYYRRTLIFMNENADNYDQEAIDWMREKAESMKQDF
ncbi:MAG: SEC-C metal-binding domain-containing protein [Pseudomonadota bacterium]